MDLPYGYNLTILSIVGTVGLMALLAHYSWRHRQVPGAAPFAVWALLIAGRGVVSGMMTLL